MKTFLKKFTIRFSIFLSCCIGFFFIDHGQGYYLGLTEGSHYNKIPWVYNKINSGSIDSNSVIFIGPSMCVDGINDSLLTAKGKYGYNNFGVNHPCNGLSYIILKKILASHKPGRVFLGLKFNHYESIHSTYPILADANEILASAKQANFTLLSCAYIKTAWNINYFTEAFKFPVRTKEPRRSKWGQDPNNVVNETEVRAQYENERAALEKLFNQQAGEIVSDPGIKGKVKGIYRYLYGRQALYFNNVQYQINLLKSCTQLLDENKIPFDFILFPTLHQQISGNTKISFDFYAKNYPDIFKGHKIIYKESEELKSFKMWADAAHLNKQGADKFSELLLPDLESEN